MAGYTRSARRNSGRSPGPRSAETTTTVTGGCVNPIRLRGFYQEVAADTGEVLALFGSSETADGILLVSCKDRRATCCGPCSRLYERDAYHLIAAGLRGGKGVPARVSEHPVLMLTLTAPSFGAVHGNRDRGQPCTCGRRHDPDDLQIGEPIDPARYRYADQVIWNHYVPELWKRTVRAIRRGLADALGVPRSKLSDVARVRFAKVAEFQRRGVVHYHAIIRVDGPEGTDAPPTAECTTQLLEEIAGAAVQVATAPLPEVLIAGAPHTPHAVRWGAQREIVALDRHTCTTAAGYIAKYATKTTETAAGGALIKPIRSPRSIGELGLTDHARTLVSAAWTVGERTGVEAFKRWAHQFGYGGHTLTKSRQYSATFAALRAARTNWRRKTNDEGEVFVRAELTYAGRGHEARSTLKIPLAGMQAGGLARGGRA